ncbi:MAG: proline--tRNA ligase [Erysipelotrichaceae bacterium]|jgi:prolyl-tRNA synthetase|nr:proline--tRNA ligase [Erysipelotrichaceae bacterium]MCI1325819.1 proline--tRNA ligase [Solobacterium sp.]MCH4044908.1 proline--tRNA ligase [Erysipelotrichaceae bacterium]MCH4122120.1 proline--tRNA ligase [Erysipelotrichaceae bacterium]MCI1362618.1 proline--tRNA ligase [Solobacterium sp.]
MRLKNSYFFTLREDAKDEDSISSNLLVRGGFIKKSSAGIYMMLPMGWRIMQKIMNIIRNEMDKTGCQELLMPALIPEDIYIASGRRAGFGHDMFSLKDRKGQNYVLGPTHEELFAIAAKMQIRSYKDMPFSLYQFETKFRDEPRPRYGLIRVREFIMKDAYTFDKDEAGLDVAYQKQFNAYKNIMNRLHLNYVIVRADTGVMGGLLSEEFQALAPMGEDTLVLCDSCDFASNIEVAPCKPEIPAEREEEKELVLEATPHSRTIEEVADHFHLPAKKFVKTLIYSVDGKPVAVMVRGDRDVNETKLRKFLKATEVELASPSVVEEVTHAEVGFAGPIGIDCPVYADEEVKYMQNFIVGANKTGYHYCNVNLKDFKAEAFADLRNIMEGDICPNCGGRIHFAHGIEVGNTFKLGTKYSKALDLQYLDANNQLQYVWMGSYGIGPARAMAALAEQNSDENGINWPKDLAPYQAAIIIISTKDEAQNEAAEKLYEQLEKAGVEVLLDDRDTRPGVKFKDMDLIGIPYRITVGRGIKDGMVELKPRTGEKVDVPVDKAAEMLIEELKK